LEQLIQNQHHLFQTGPLTTQGLGLFGMVPDLGILQLSEYFGQALLLGLVVKGTP
jgi:hypothetical protein